MDGHQFAIGLPSVCHQFAVGWPSSLPSGCHRLTSVATGGQVNLRSVGSAHLPTGQQTDALFKRRVVHCTGKAGDVFLANYMTAHLIAPNVRRSASLPLALSPRIRPQHPLTTTHVQPSQNVACSPRLRPRPTFGTLSTFD